MSNPMVFDRRIRNFALAAYVQTVVTMLYGYHENIIGEAIEAGTARIDCAHLNFVKKCNEILTKQGTQFNMGDWRFDFDESLWPPDVPSSYLNRARLYVKPKASSEICIFLLDFNEPMQEGVSIMTGIPWGESRLLRVNVFNVRFEDSSENMR